MRIKIMSLDMDSILAHSKESVNKIPTELQFYIDNTDYSMQTVEKAKPIKRDKDVDNEVAYVNSTYVKLIEQVDKGTLKDSFRSLPSKENESRTERSLKETLRRFNRFASCLNSSNSQLVSLL